MSGQITQTYAAKYLFELIEAIDDSSSTLWSASWSLSRQEDKLVLIVPQSEHMFAELVNSRFCLLVGVYEKALLIDEEEAYHLPIAP